MIIPSIDLMKGNAVQLVGGKTLELDAGDPRPLATKFARVGEFAVIDLDAAMGKGSNADVIEDLIDLAPRRGGLGVRVGGGIRDVDTAIRWLDRGASKVILGTAATPDILSQLPGDRTIAALDALHDDVVVEGWTKATGRKVTDRIAELRDHAGGFLLTFVEREGQLKGFDESRIRELVEAAGDCEVTVAGGVATPADIALADRLGADAQVGMALYKGHLDLADALVACLTTDRPDHLFPTIVTDEHDRALGLAYSNLQSLRHTIETGEAAYYSRSRQELWIKGKTSGNTQELLSITRDCDKDALRFRVRQRGAGFCHLGSTTCFGASSGLALLDETIRRRLADAPEGSYTRRLFNDPDLLRSKLLEEATELAAATTPAEAAWEAADLAYFALVAAIARGTSLADIERTLDERTRKVTRRPGNAKPKRGEASS